MRNRRLTIFPLAMILMTACGDSTAINPEMLDLRGTWSVQTWTVTQVASPNTVVNMLAGTAGDPVEQDGVVDAWRFLYDDGTMLSVINYPDTLATNQPIAGYGSISLDASLYQPELAHLPKIWKDASLYPLETYCVDAAAEIEYCKAATSSDVMIINEAAAVNGVWSFVHSGDDLTLTADTMTDGTAIMTFDFGSGTAEAAKWVQTLDRVIVDYNRCSLTDLCGRPR